MNSSKEKLCSDCPRNCNLPRALEYSPGAATGYCRKVFQPTVARAALHMWEEPCISGTNGSGAVFFGGCNLRCVFCQNSEISQEARGKTVTAKILKKICQLNRARGTQYQPGYAVSLRTGRRRQLER